MAAAAFAGAVLLTVPFATVHRHHRSVVNGDAMGTAMPIASLAPSEEDQQLQSQDGGTSPSIGGRIAEPRTQPQTAPSLPAAQPAAPSGNNALPPESTAPAHGVPASGTPAPGHQDQGEPEPDAGQALDKPTVRSPAGSSANPRRAADGNGATLAPLSAHAPMLPGLAASRAPKTPVNETPAHRTVAVQPRVAAAKSAAAAHVAPVHAPLSHTADNSAHSRQTVHADQAEAPAKQAARAAATPAVPAAAHEVPAPTHAAARLAADRTGARADTPATPAAAPATTPGWSTKVITSTYVIKQGEFVASNRMRISMLTDGNLVISDENGVVRWSSHTEGRGFEAVFQADGHFVVYTRDMQPVWQSGTAGNPGAQLVIQDDGNVVITSTSGATLWSAGTQH
ncbi:hypothetical protein [Actinacidiphila guanduensis]|nr:hypothetical protein [Actinacidiphila guanduensis]